MTLNLSQIRKEAEGILYFWCGNDQHAREHSRLPECVDARTTIALCNEIERLHGVIEEAGKEVGTALIHSNPSLIGEHLFKADEILNGPRPTMQFDCKTCGSKEHDTSVCLKKPGTENI